MLIPIRVQASTNPGLMEDQSVSKQYVLTYFHIRFLFEANLHKVKRTDNIYRMFQDSVYINCLQYQFYSDNTLKFTVRSLDSLISFFREHIL